jgi:hypothetical protein
LRQPEYFSAIWNEQLICGGNLRGSRYHYYLDITVNRQLSTTFDVQGDGNVTVEDEVLLGMKDFPVIHSHPYTEQNREGVDLTLHLFGSGNSGDCAAKGSNKENISKKTAYII